MKVSSLNAQTREAVGKSAARKLRRRGLTPAVVYGHGSDTMHVAVPERELSALISHAGSHALVELQLATGGRGKKHLALIKDVQRDYLKDTAIHADFQKVALDEEIESVVPVALVGESAGARDGGILQHGVWELQVRALARSLPEQLEVDISGLGIGDNLRVADVSFPDEVQILNNPEEVLASILAPAKAAAAVEEVEAAAPEITEPELIQKERAEGAKEE